MKASPVEHQEPVNLQRRTQITSERQLYPFRRSRHTLKLLNIKSTAVPYIVHGPGALEQQVLPHPAERMMRSILWCSSPQLSRTFKQIAHQVTGYWSMRSGRCGRISLYTVIRGEYLVTWSNRRNPVDS